MKQRVWLITGVSSGLGQALAQTVLNNGDQVYGTFRSRDQAESFEKTYGPSAKGLVMDMRDHPSIEAGVTMLLEQNQTIDVLVNNAGFGFAGAIEEATMEEVKDVFEANFFGALKLTKEVLPIMRKNRAGHIIQISSHGGFKAFSGFGIYNASKFALEGMSEALAQELRPLGIKVTIVEPGPFRTRFAAGSFREAQEIIEDYQDTAGVFRTRMKGVNGKQEGDPQKGARAIWDITISYTPPLRLPLGKVAILSLNSKIESVLGDLEKYREVAEGAVFQD